MKSKEAFVWFALGILLVFGFFYFIVSIFGINVFVVLASGQSASGDVQDFVDAYDGNLETFALTGESSVMEFNYPSGEEVELKLNPRNGYYFVECFFEGNSYEIATITQNSHENYSVPTSCQDQLHIRITYYSNGELSVINGSSGSSEEVVEELNETIVEGNETLVDENETLIDETNETSGEEEVIEESPEVSENESVSEEEVEEVVSEEPVSEEIVEESSSEEVVEESPVEESSEGESFSTTGEVTSDIDGEFYEITVYDSSFGTQDFGAASVEYNSSNTIIYACGNITEPGAYTLNQSINAGGVGNNCLLVQNNSVEINLMGYTISNGQYAVYVEGYNSTKAHNGSIDSFSQAVHLIDSISDNISNIYVSSTDYLVTTSGLSEYLNIENCIGVDGGIISLGSNHSRVNNITSDLGGMASSMGVGLEGSNNTLSNIYTSHNGWGGMWLVRAYNNTIQNFTGNNNGMEGLRIVASTGNNFTNLVTNSNNAGIYLYSDSNAGVNTTNNHFYNVTTNENLFGLFVGEVNNTLELVNACCNSGGYGDILALEDSNITQSTCASWIYNYTEDSYLSKSCDFSCPVCSSNCNYNVNSSMNVTYNRSCSGAYVFNVVADDVVIDCQGHNLEFTGTGFYGAIYASSDYDNITIKNCTFNGSSSSTGVGLYSSNSQVVNSTFTGLGTGVLVGDNVSVSGNTFDSMENYALFMEYSDWANISNNVINNSALGIRLSYEGYSQYNNFSNNVISNCERAVYGTAEYSRFYGNNYTNCSPGASYTACFSLYGRGNAVYGDSINGSAKYLLSAGSPDSTYYYSSSSPAVLSHFDFALLANPGSGYQNVSCANVDFVNMTLPSMSSTSSAYKAWYLNITNVTNSSGGKLSNFRAKVYENSTFYQPNSITSSSLTKVHDLEYANGESLQVVVPDYFYNSSGQTNVTSYLEIKRDGYESKIIDLGHITSNGEMNVSNLSADITAPLISGLSPISPEYVGTKYFRFRVLDSSSTDCSVYINGQIAGTVTDVNIDNESSYDSQNYVSVNLFSAGSYNWYVSCTDFAGNVGNSSLIGLVLSNFPSGSSPSGGWGPDGEVKFSDTCVSSWQCSEWDTCVSELQRRSCKDVNFCLVSSGKPETTRTCEVCNENWACNWSACVNGLSTPNCIDTNNCGSTYDKPSAISCEVKNETSGVLVKAIDNLLGTSFGGSTSCIPSVKCSEWSKCDASYSFSDLRDGVENIEGSQSRTCVDSEGCLEEDYEERSCYLSLDVYAKEEEWCGKNYLFVYNKLTDELLARILDEKSSETPSFGISLVTGNTVAEYCESCFDGIQNGDEEGLDCGGSCTACSERNYSVSWFDRLMGWLGF